MTDRVIIFALWLLIFASSSQFLIIAPILPQLGKELHIPNNRLGLLITSYALFLALFAFIAGPVSDRIGRRKILLTGTGMMTFALFMHSGVYDFYSMLAVRALTGASGGIFKRSLRCLYRNGLNMVRLAFQHSNFSIYYYVSLSLSSSYLALSAKCPIFFVGCCLFILSVNIFCTYFSMLF